MRLNIIYILFLALLLMVSQTFAQDSRRPQIEVYGGAAIPLSPDVFKDYYKVGFSIHGQYVLFPSPTVGISLGAAYEAFTFNSDAFLEDFGLSGSGIDVEGSASIVELGVGIRPYLTSPEANTQFFVFGMATFNHLKDEATASGFGVTESAKEEADKFGLAAGAGFELPAGATFNIILQGLTRFIFTEDEVTSFIGVTTGVVF